MDNLPDLDYALPSDEYVEYSHVPNVAAAFAQIEELFDIQDKHIFSLQEIIHSSSKGHNLQNCSLILKNFNQSLATCL